MKEGINMINLLIISIFVCIVGGILLFSKVGKRIRLRASGTADELISRDASTPEGAKAYYNTAITAKEDDYQKAYSIYTQMLGKIQTYEEQLRSLQKENMQLNLNINTCVDKNDDEGAKVYLKRQQEVNEKVDIRLQLIIWSMIDKLKDKGNVEVDYLQIFKIRKEANKIVINQSQEVPEY